VVVTYCWVSSAMRADVIVVAEERVERLMVLPPTITMSLELPDCVCTMADDVERGAAVLVTRLDVMVFPEASVVVTGIVVLTVVDCGTDDVSDCAALLAADDDESITESDADVVCAAVAEVSDGVLDGLSVVVVVGATTTTAVSDVVISLVGVEVGAALVVVSGAGEVCCEVVVVTASTALVLVVLSAVEVEVVTPVPTTWRLLGMMPSSSSLSLICAKPAKKENIVGSARMRRHKQSASRYWLIPCYVQ
jgi:hypothetical protein